MKINNCADQPAVYEDGAGAGAAVAATGGQGLDPDRGRRVPEEQSELKKRTHPYQERVVHHSKST